MRIGLIVNPYAGLGGPLGLKGSDALCLKTIATAPGPAMARAARTLSGLEGLEILTAAGAMGEAAARAAGQSARIVHHPPPRTGATDTAAAARALCAAGVDLLLFAGGDGTARDLLGHTGSLPVLGIPAGVTMASAVFATSPAAAAAMLRDLAGSAPIRTEPAAILDRPPGSPLRVAGMLTAPQGRRRQQARAGGSVAADAELGAACIHLAHELADCPLAIIGPGATMQAVKQSLAGDGTLLGVDAYAHGRLVARDADAARLWQLLAAAPPGAARLVLGVVGGQGFLIGRGDKPLSSRLIGHMGAGAITVLASADKLAALDGGRLLVDSGDEAVDAALAGPISVRTGPRRRMVMMMEAA